MAMTLVSSAFKAGQPIPARYSCKGEDISPELRWEGAPEDAQSFALIIDDPDAPKGTWDHWVLYNIPKKMASLGEDASASLPAGVLVGRNSWGNTEYGGPCPPSGTHRYFFRVYALSGVLKLNAGATKQELLQAMEGKILGQAELMGTFSKDG